MLLCKLFETDKAEEEELLAKSPAAGAAASIIAPGLAAATPPAAVLAESREPPKRGTVKAPRRPEARKPEWLVTLCNFLKVGAPRCAVVSGRAGGARADPIMSPRRAASGPIAGAGLRGAARGGIAAPRACARHARRGPHQVQRQLHQGALLLAPGAARPQRQPLGRAGGRAGGWTDGRRYKLRSQAADLKGLCIRSGRPFKHDNHPLSLINLEVRLPALRIAAGAARGPGERRR
jgi:hypothetical protein